MFEKFLVPIYLPSWLGKAIVDLKRALVPPASVPQIDIRGERNVEWSFIISCMPDGPGNAIEFGCEQGFMSFMAAEKGYKVVANDLQEQHFYWQHPNVEFLVGDFVTAQLPSNFFDLAINCSSVEHVGVAGRYGIEVDDDRGDIEVMRKLADALKPKGLLLMTAPVGIDCVLAPWCRVYGRKRLPDLLAPFLQESAAYWTKNDQNRWVMTSEDAALSFQPRNATEDPHQCAYALGCFVLRKKESRS